MDKTNLFIAITLSLFMAEMIGIAYMYHKKQDNDSVRVWFKDNFKNIMLFSMATVAVYGIISFIILFVM